MSKPDEFCRIKRLPPDVFAEVNRLKAGYRAGFICIGLMESEQRIRQAVRGVRRLMQRADQTLGEYSRLKEASA